MKPSPLATPMIGAQVFIEPGQSPHEIEHLFKMLHDHQMSVCRIRMFEKYMRTPQGGWDFSLFDVAFHAAQKYKVKIFATLFPMTDFTDVGGFKFPRTQAHFEEVAEYIHQVVCHYRTFPALYGWVLINEPGQVTLPQEPFTREKFAEWKAQQAASTQNSQGYYHFPFEEQCFLVDYNTWYLQWIADTVQADDPGHHLHVNNHAIFQNIAEYDFPAWRPFLDSFGGSAHASWHFGYFERPQYALGMAADCDLVRSGAGEKPWLMTEIQGGNNTYSGFNALCPTQEEITQWLWTILGSGGKGGIFWSLNSRASGFEAGEWALLDMQDNPSDRMLAAGVVAQMVEQHTDFFNTAVPLTAPIHLLYTRESLWIEKTLQRGGTPYEGREPGGVMKSVLGYYQTLNDLGIAPQLAGIHEFDFGKADYSGDTVILAHQISIPSDYWDKLRAFVEKGGTLIMDGLTAYYDEHAHCIMKHEFPLADLCGASIKEFKLRGDRFDIGLMDPEVTLPAHCWQGFLHCESAQPIATLEEEVTACRNRSGRGVVLWIPTLVGLAARKAGTGKLAQLLLGEITAQTHRASPHFQSYTPGVLLRTLRNGNRLLSIVINKNSEPVEVQVCLPGSEQTHSLHLAPEETRIFFEPAID